MISKFLTRVMKLRSVDFKVMFWCVLVTYHRRVVRIFSRRERVTLCSLLVKCDAVMNLLNDFY